jgi:hypothetical protein
MMMPLSPPLPGEQLLLFGWLCVTSLIVNEFEHDLAVNVKVSAEQEKIIDLYIVHTVDHLGETVEVNPDVIGYRGFRDMFENLLKLMDVPCLY